MVMGLSSFVFVSVTRLDEPLTDIIHNVPFAIEYLRVGVMIVPP